MNMIDDYNDDLGLFYDDELDETLGVDEEIKMNHDDRINDFLNSDDDIENFDFTDEEKDRILAKLTRQIRKDIVNTTFLEKIQFELSKPEYKRKTLNFVYHGEDCEGVPLKKISDRKFIFVIDKKLRGINLDEVDEAIF